MKMMSAALAALCLVAAAPALAATDGAYPLDRVLHESVAPPTAFCEILVPVSYEISNSTPSGYTFSTTVVLPWGETQVSPPIDCVLDGRHAACVPPTIKEVVFDGRPFGFDEVLTLSNVGADFSWVSDTSFLSSSLAHLSCAGTMCLPAGGTSTLQCTMSLTALFTK